SATRSSTKTSVCGNIHNQPTQTLQRHQRDPGDHRDLVFYWSTCPSPHQQVRLSEFKSPSPDGSESVDVDSGGFQLFGGRSSAWRFLYEAASLCFIFGKPIRVTVNVKDLSPVEPTLFVLSPLSPDPLTKNPEVCLAAGFRPQRGQMVLNVENKSVSVGTSRAVLSREEKSFFFAGFNDKTIDSCQLHGASATREDPEENCDKTRPEPTTGTPPPDIQTSQTDDKTVESESCEDFHPEGARLNFYLLLMNGIRLVFTKTLAFNTVLTIRAVLF
ncbi:uncharacterized protein LOC115058215, partial [Echeneis naucrates]|uniref:uncharacterized protein LOC115058215 n=1 Tax=Echeneis naucrates TaxID=173247 RepID=UPI001113A9EF